MIELTLEQLKHFAPGAKASILAGIAANAELIDDYEIAPPRRLAHFLAQLAHESAGFRTCVEYASGAAYENRKDLGNTRPGDGKKYRGRGLIQCTGRANYRAFTAWAKEHIGEAPDFEATPAAVAEFPWALLSALWYWDTRKLNALADKDDLRGITKKINGGYNGFIDRQNWFRKAWAIWGTGIAVRFAGAGKPLITSKSAGAATLLGGTSVAGLADMSGYGSTIWLNVRQILDDVPMLKPALLSMIMAAAGYLIYRRWRQARDYES